MYANEDSNASPSDLSQLVLARKYDQVAALLVKDVLASCRLSSDGRSPLMIAASMPDLEMVKLLVEMGAADPNQLSFVRGDSALYFAVQAQALPIVLYLICVGGKLLKDREGSSPLDWARTNLPSNNRLLQVLEHFNTAGIDGFGLPKRRIALAGALGPPSCNRFLGQAKEEELLRGLRGFSLVDETPSDLIIGGILPYVYRGSAFNTPVITFISKKAVPQLFGNKTLQSSDEEIGRQNPALVPHLMNSREAHYRCLIDMSDAKGLVLSPKASYLDPLSGFVLAPLIDVNSSRSVAEFLITVVTELFQTSPPLVHPTVYVPQFGDESHSDPNVSVPQPPMSASSSSNSLKARSLQMGHFLRAVALTCSKFHKGTALRTVPREGAVVGVIPIKCREIAVSKAATATTAVSPDDPEDPNDQPSLHSLGVSAGVYNPEYDQFVKFAELDERRRKIEVEDAGFGMQQYSKEEALAILADLEGKGPQPTYRESRYPGFNFALPIRIELRGGGGGGGEDEGLPIPVVKMVSPPGGFFVATPSCTVKMEGGVQVGYIVTPMIASKGAWEQAYSKDPINAFKQLLGELQSLLGREPPLRVEAAAEAVKKPKKKKKGLFGGLFK